MNVSSLYRNADLASIARRVNTFSVSLQDHQMVTPTLARVVLSWTGQQPDRSEVAASIADLFNGLASPVESSFRSLQSGPVSVAIGFVKANREVKEYTSEIAANQGRYKAMASNLLMDREDQSLWEVHSGSTGKFLVKKGNEDLSELVHLATARKATLPTLAQVASVPAEVQEFAAFVDPTVQEVMHGYIVGRADGGKVRVLAFEGDGQDQEIPEDLLVEVVNLDGKDQEAAKIKMSAEVAADRGAMVSYYTKLFGSYAPDYLKNVITMIDSHSIA
jgi:hypothetical protein